MTYVLAWKTAEAVYVHADTAATIEGSVLPGTTGVSSNFDEAHIIQPGLMIEERLIKIHVVNNKYLFGIAGLVSLATEVIRCFSVELTRWQS